MPNPKRRVFLIVITAITAAFLLLTGVAMGQEEPTLENPGVIAHGVTFFGSVTLNGAPAPDGTPIEAIRGLLEDIVCGETTTENGEYMIDVSDGFGDGADFQEGCNGSEIVFRSGGLIAAERGQFAGGGAQDLDLTFGSVASPTVPPQLPDTGSGGSSSSGAAIPPWLLWALAATGIAAVGAAAIARGRAVQP